MLFEGIYARLGLFGVHRLKLNVSCDVKRQSRTLRGRPRGRPDLGDVGSFLAAAPVPDFGLFLLPLGLPLPRFAGGTGLS